MNSTTRKLLILIAVLILLLAGVLGARFFLAPQGPAESPAPTASADTTAEPTEDPYAALPTRWSREEYAKNEAINSDYVFTLRFESGLIDLPVVQGSSNDSYLRVDWESGKYTEEGTTFLDFRNVIGEDHNLIVYGHYVYRELDPSQTRMFTPLHQLADEDNYEKNRYVDLLLEDKIQRYEVADVYYCQLIYDEAEKAYLYTYDDMQYFLTNYTAEYLPIYRRAIDLFRFYDTGVTWDENDQILTLQTCVENHEELRLIVIAKLVEEVPLP
ncbi:MAG: class B sortase [Erysipelotrichaceae bacterium]|nr:class B sortase [Erysipelotrichaceae bacterium]